MLNRGTSGVGGSMLAIPRPCRRRPREALRLGTRANDPAPAPPRSAAGPLGPAEPQLRMTHACTRRAGFPSADSGSYTGRP